MYFDIKLFIEICFKVVAYVKYGSLVPMFKLSKLTKNLLSIMKREMYNDCIIIPRETEGYGVERVCLSVRPP